MGNKLPSNLMRKVLDNRREFMDHVKRELGFLKGMLKDENDD